MPIQSPSYFENDHFAKNLGIRLTHNEMDYARCELEINKTHTNGLGSVHGAVLFALADITFAAACNTAMPSIGLQADIKYFKKPQGDRLIAEARAHSTSNRIGYYEVEIFDDIKNIVARFCSTAYRLPPKRNENPSLTL